MSGMCNSSYYCSSKILEDNVLLCGPFRTGEIVTQWKNTISTHI